MKRSSLASLRSARKSAKAAIFLTKNGKAQVAEFAKSPRPSTPMRKETKRSTPYTNRSKQPRKPEEGPWPFNLKRNMDAASAPPPIPFTRLKEIANGACNTALADVTTYDHPRTDSWNTEIINYILKTLIAETSPTPTTPPSFKFAVNSTIIQHQGISSRTPAPTTTGNLSPTAASPAETVPAGAGRRGMHSATGAYWNNEKDGMWSFKYEAGDGKGLDVVVSVIWIAI